MNHSPRTGLISSLDAAQNYPRRMPRTRRTFPVVSRQATPADLLPLIKGGSRPMQRRIVALFN